MINLTAKFFGAVHSYLKENVFDSSAFEQAAETISGVTRLDGQFNAAPIPVRAQTNDFSQQ